MARNDTRPLTVPLVPAGPILQRLTPSWVTVWLATSKRIDPQKLGAEVWDPLPDDRAGYIPEYRPALGLAGSRQTVEVCPLGNSLFVYRITLKAAGGEWPAGRALAYRELKARDGAQPETFDEEWEVRVPTELVRLRSTAALPTWSERLGTDGKPSKGDWIEDQG